VEEREMIIYTQDGCRNCDEVKKRFPNATVKMASELAEEDRIEIIMASNGVLPILKVDGIFWGYLGRDWGVE